MRALSYQTVKDNVNSYGYTLISDTYKEAHVRLDLICNREHKCSISYTNLKSGKRCKYCAIEDRRNELEKAKAVFAEYGYSLTNDNYTRSDVRMDVYCPEGHDWKVSLSSFMSGRRCSGCEGNRKKTIEEVRELLNNEGYELTSIEYKGVNKNLQTKCPEGHIWPVYYSAFRKGVRCSFCSGRRQKTYEEVKKFFEDANYKLITGTYTKNDVKMHCICPKGHHCYISYADIRVGGRCPDCQGLRVSHQQVKSYFEKECYILLTDTYKNARTRLDYRCPNGHEHNTIWNYFQQGQRCPTCFLAGVSKMEKELFEILKPYFDKLTKKRFKVNIEGKTHIKRFELDMFNEPTMRGIEFDGTHWHSEKQLIESKTENGWPTEDAINYHEIKDSFFINHKGIEILHIKEEDWKNDKQACIQLAIAFLSGNCSILLNRTT